MFAYVVPTLYTVTFLVMRTLPPPIERHIIEYLKYDIKGLVLQLKFVDLGVN